MTELTIKNGSGSCDRQARLLQPAGSSFLGTFGTVPPMDITLNDPLVSSG